jgi:hypothetical protein
VRAHPGDHLVIRSHRIGEPDVEAEIIRVEGEESGPPYWVRWLSDGHESFIFPGSDAVVERSHRRRHKATA